MIYHIVSMYNKPIVRVACLLLLALFPMLGSGQNVSIQGKLDRTEIKTGEQAAIDLIIRTDDLDKTKFYLKEDPSKSEAYMVLEFGAIDTIDIDGKLKEITARLLLTSFDSTLITIPPIVVETPQGKAETEAMALKVVQPEVDAAHPESFKDIKAPWEVALHLRDWLILIVTSWIFWLVLVLIVAGYGLYRFLTQPKSQYRYVAPTPAPRPLSLWERTTIALGELEQDKPWERGLYKDYYSRLVEIIKQYLDESRAWSTLEMTTSELRDKVRNERLPHEQIKKLDAILLEADLSKFAKGVPSQDVARTSLLEARHLLEAFEAERQSQLRSQTISPTEPQDS